MISLALVVISKNNKTASCPFWYLKLLILLLKLNMRRMKLGWTGNDGVVNNYDVFDVI